VNGFCSFPVFLAVVVVVLVALAVVVGPLQKSELQHLLVKIVVLLIVQFVMHPFSLVVIG